MLIMLLVTSAIVTVAFALALRHMPLLLRRGMALLPEWLTASVIHFGYGAWMGGVLGHLVAAFVSIPLYFLLKYNINPRTRRELAESRSASKRGLSASASVA